MIERTKKGFNVTFKEFPTHVTLSKTQRKNKVKILKEKRLKITSQVIYNSMVSKFTRAKVVEFIKTFMLSSMGNSSKIKIKDSNYPVSIKLEAHIPITYGGVCYHNDKLIFKKFQRWDLDNMAYIWFKCFNDCLVENKILKDDSILFIQNTGGVSFVEETFENRKLVFIVEYAKN